jgi:hypothetical protein
LRANTGLARLLIPVAEGRRPFACPFRCRMAHPTPEEEKATIHGPGFALATAQQSRRESRFFWYRSWLNSSLANHGSGTDATVAGLPCQCACVSPDRLEGGRRHARQCFLFHRRTIVRTIRHRQQDAKHRQVPQCYRDAFRSYMVSRLQPPIMQLDPRCNAQQCIFFMLAMASQSARRGRLQPPGVQSMFFNFDEEAHRRSAEGPTSLAHLHGGGLTVAMPFVGGCKKPRTDKHPSDDLSSWNFSTGNDRKTWGRWIADEPPAGIRGASFTDMRR